MSDSAAQGHDWRMDITMPGDATQTLADVLDVMRSNDLQRQAAFVEWLAGEWYDAKAELQRGQERIRCRSVLLRDLDTLDLEPIGVIFEQRDRTAKVEFFEAAAERDPHLSKLRCEFESFDKAVSVWHRSALLCAPGEEDFHAR